MECPELANPFVWSCTEAAWEVLSIGVTADAASHGRRALRIGAVHCCVACLLLFAGGPRSTGKWEARKLHTAGCSAAEQSSAGFPSKKCKCCFGM